MAYKLRCNKCDHVFVARSTFADCPRSSCQYHNTTFIESVLDTAVDVALAYTGVTAAIEVADAVGSLVGSLFDWD